MRRRGSEKRVEARYARVIKHEKFKNLGENKAKQYLMEKKEGDALLRWPKLGESALSMHTSVHTSSPHVIARIRAGVCARVCTHVCAHICAACLCALVHVFTCVRVRVCAHVCAHGFARVLAPWYILGRPSNSNKDELVLLWKVPHMGTNTHSILAQFKVVEKNKPSQFDIGACIPPLRAGRWHAWRHRASGRQAATCVSETTSTTTSTRSWSASSRR